MACDPANVLGGRTTRLRDWGWFALAALLPIVAVALLGLRAAENEEAAVRRGMRLELEQTAQRVQQQYDAAQQALAAEPTPRPGSVARPAQAPFADAVVVSADGHLLAPEAATAPQSGRRGPPQICASLIAALADRRPDAGASDARQQFLEQCGEAQSSTGRYLWPVVALDNGSRKMIEPARLVQWFEQKASLLADAERAACQLEVRAAQWLPAESRKKVLAALAATRPPDRDLAAVLQAQRALLLRRSDDGGWLRWSDGRSRGWLKEIGEEQLGGFVIHASSLSRAVRGGWPELPTGMSARLVLGVESPAGPAVQLLDRGAALELAWTGDEAVAAKTRQSLLVLLVAVGCCILVALAMAVLLFARVRAERRLSSLRTDFVAAVSHELRTPLASLRMLSELLEQGRVAADERDEVTEAIAREARRLGTTVHRLLTFSRMEAGKARPASEEVNLSELAADAVATFVERHPDVQVVGPDRASDVRVLCDGDQLTMVLDNLLSNAHKYAVEGQPYEVSVTQDRDEVHLSVRDHGPGVAAQDQRRVFEPFERAADRLSEATEGSGIGLSLVRHVARSHGGRAWVESEPGEGARFIVALPRSTQ